LRRSAKELLVYFLLHPAGASAETAMAALWPEIDGERGRERFWTAMSNLRTRLRNPEPDKGMDDDSMPLLSPGTASTTESQTACSPWTCGTSKQR